MESLVSVIIPVYKVEDFLDRCMESIVHQTYKNIEIILVDDESPDSCPQKCDEWAKRDSRVKVIHKPNQGAGYARNSGIDIASGYYFMFVDADDYLAEDAIETLYERIVKDDSDLVIGQFVKVYSDGIERKSSYGWMYDTVIDAQEALELLGSRKKPLHCYTWAKLYRKMIFDDLRFSTLTRGEDVEILPPVINACRKVSIESKVVYYYFQREGSAVHNNDIIHCLDSLRATLNGGRFLLDRNRLKAARMYYHSAICQYMTMKDKKEAKRLIRDVFNSKERKLLRSGRDLNMIVSILSYRFPSIYKLYKKCFSFGKKQI